MITIRRIDLRDNPKYAKYMSIYTVQSCVRTCRKLLRKAESYSYIGNNVKSRKPCEMAESTSPRGTIVRPGEGNIGEGEVAKNRRRDKSEGKQGTNN